MELTKEEAIRLHRELWGWLAENPNKNKFQWPGWENSEDDYTCDGLYNGEIIPFYCFACYATVLQIGDYADDDSCAACVLEWGSGVCDKWDDSIIPKPIGLFTKWNESKSDRMRSKLAAKIRDLPEREVPNEPDN